jgi:hypothetical protein
MPRLSEILETASGWTSFWTPVYQALFTCLTDITALHYDNEPEGALDLTDIDSEYPPLEHYQDLAIILSKYLILLPSENSGSDEMATTHRLGPSFPNNANPTGADPKSKFDQESVYDLCKHISMLCHTASTDGPLTTADLASSVTGRYAEEDAFGTFLSVLEEYQLLRRVNLEEPADGDADDPSRDGPDALWAVRLQRSVNRDRTTVTLQYGF